MVYFKIVLASKKSRSGRKRKISNAVSQKNLMQMYKHAQKLAAAMFWYGSLPCMEMNEKFILDYAAFP